MPEALPECAPAFPTRTTDETRADSGDKGLHGKARQFCRRRLQRRGHPDLALGKAPSNLCLCTDEHRLSFLFSRESLSDCSKSRRRCTPRKGERAASAE